MSLLRLIEFGCGAQNKTDDAENRENSVGAEHGSDMCLGSTACTLGQLVELSRGKQEERGSFLS